MRQAYDGDCFAASLLTRNHEQTVRAHQEDVDCRHKAGHECVREGALSARCESVPGLVATQGLDQLAAVNRDEKTPFALSASLMLQAVKLASRLICVALRFVFSVL
jgi:hypothetical protein